MKTLLRNFISTGLTVCALIVGMLEARAQVSVGVDPGKTWNGFMNVYELGGASAYGSPWAPAALPAVFTSTSLRVSPNTSAYDPTNPYYVNPDGTGNKRMEANIYVEELTLGGNTVNFSGMTLENTLASGYYAQAFIKEFGPGWSWVGWDFLPLATGTEFNISRSIAAGNIVQYGIMTVGPVANPATVGQLGFASVALIPEPASAALVGFGLLLALGRWRRH